ncbi:hypothetical protein OTU49_013837 [Cherax quadricarinatus]|uniref:Uncharacterized protein n=1 Tax=Cherax quadricarinatus TaxID=27406 RepID=A0AAW0YHY3_CHEQU
MKYVLQLPVLMFSLLITVTARPQYAHGHYYEYTPPLEPNPIQPTPSEIEIGAPVPTTTPSPAPFPPPVGAPALADSLDCAECYVKTSKLICEADFVCFAKKRESQLK